MTPCRSNVRMGYFLSLEAASEPRVSEEQRGRPPVSHVSLMGQRVCCSSQLVYEV